LNRTGYVEQMRDSEVVASIVAGEPEGLAVAYDRYASDLYGYCRSLLREPDDAADAVQDTFVIAASKLSGLREPDRLRAWLFAVARNECLHRLKSRRAATPLQDAPEPADESADVGGAAERAETIALVRAAADGLNDGERDVINQVWHGLEVPEVAAVLGVSRNHAYSLFSRAREQLEASVAVLLVGRSGRRDCAALDRLLGDWDGRLNARLRRKVGRHIDQCGTCSDRRRRELTPAMLYSLTPGAVLAIAALRAGPAAAAGPLAGVRDAVLGLARHAPPHAATLHIGRWTAGGRSVHSFGASGFPKPPHGGHLGLTPRPHLPISVVGGTAVAATATLAVSVAVVPHAHRPPAAQASFPPGAAAPLAGMRSEPPGAPRGGPGDTSTALTRITTGPAAGHHGGSGAAVSSATAATAGPSATGGAAPVADPASGAASQAQDPAGDSPSATVSVSEDGSPAAGTLTVSPTAVLINTLGGATLTLTANGGPVAWSIDESSSLLGSVSVSPSSGELAAGQSTTVTLSVTSLISLSSQLTVEPGGQVVSVVIGLL
jgi:RNA polymerase sigma factor (sigma-70 family)